MNWLDVIIAVSAAALLWHLAIRWERGSEQARKVIEDARRRTGLMPAGQAALAAMAERYAHGDQQEGRKLANHLRERLPGVSDVEIMRAVRALRAVALYYVRISGSEAEGLAEYLHAMGGAALELTEVERMDVPRA